MADPISLSDFGPRFLEELLTPELVQAQIRSAIPARLWVDEPGTAAGWVDLRGVGKPVRTVHDCEIEFQVTVSLTVHLSTPLGPLPEIRAGLPLSLTFRAYEPLLLYVHIPRVSREALTLEYSGNIVDWAIIESAVRGTFADQVNRSIEESEYACIVDLEAIMLEETAKGLNDPSQPSRPGVDLGGKKGTLLPRDVPGFCVLDSGQSMEGSLLLRRGERLQVLVYGRLTYLPGMGFSHGFTGRLRVKGAESWANAESTQVYFGRCDWDDWHLSVFPHPDEWFVAPKTGWYRFRLEGEYVSGPCEFEIRQRRGGSRAELAPDAARICFDEFGPRLFHRGITPEHLQRAISAEITKLAQSGGLRFPWEGSPFGAVTLEVLPKVAKVSEVAALRPDLHALRELELEITVRGHRGDHRLFTIPVRATIVLSVLGTRHPVAIEVRLDRLSDLSIDPDGVQAIDDKVEKAVRRLLASDLVEQGREKLVAFLNEHVRNAGVSSQVVSKIAEENALAALPKPAAPLPVFSGIKVSGSVRPGERGEHAVTLRKGQKISVSARVQPKEKAGLWGIESWLAVYDARFGVLERETAVLPAGSRRASTLRLSFRAPTDDEYRVGIRCHPNDGEIYEGLDYTIQVK